jgi:TolB-like protein/Tfp pilus assembly protein PilF
MGFITELKRRNVFRVGAAYLMLGWVVVEVTSTVAPAFGLPDWTLTLVTWLGVIALPFVLLFAWAFELTPEGLKRDSEVDRTHSIAHETGTRLNYVIIALLAVAILMVAVDRYLPSASPGNSAIAVETVTSIPAAPQSAAKLKPSIAVLPFTDMSENQDQEYFADGIAEELLNLLAGIPELRVIARTSSFAYKGKELPIQEIASKLNVAYLLEGSIRKSGDKIRITAQLIDAENSSHLWSQTWDRSLTDIFAVQDEIAAAVVEQSKVSLIGQIPRTTTTDPAAYELKLRARNLWSKGTENAYNQSVALLREALEIDPNYADAWASLAYSYLYQSFFIDNALPYSKRAELARDAANKALAVEPTHVNAQLVLAEIALARRDIASATQYYLQMQKSGTGQHLAGMLADIFGQTDTYVALSEQDTRDNPQWAYAHGYLGETYMSVGRIDDAISSWRTSLLLNPESPVGHAAIGRALLETGQAEAALAETRLEPREINRLHTLVLVFRALGQPEKADAALAELIQNYGREEPYWVAEVYALSGDNDNAFTWLDRVLEDEYAGGTSLHRSPAFKALHGDERWEPTLRRFGLAPDQLAKIEIQISAPD